jgi:hypothetical protein
VAGNTCNLNNVLVLDGLAAGLDYVTSSGSLGGMTATGCVGVDFGGVMNLSRVNVVAAATDDACAGSTCCCGYCGTGDVMNVFYGSVLGTYTFFNSYSVTASLTSYLLTLPLARYVVVCRTGFGTARDDILVDAILACQ